MDKLKFKVSAELKNILGKDLITSPHIAMLELVKNSYDAHATKVEITFTEDRIVIADNGKGMSLDDLTNKWLFVAYSAKSDGTEDKSYRSKFKRHYAGAKGIGRMSCDRLARFLTLTTRSEEGGCTEVLNIDWASFDGHKQEEFSSIDVLHDTYSKIPSFPEGQHTGTILDFTGIHNMWGKSEILSLRKSLEKMINPFSGGEEFKIEIIVPSERENDSALIESINHREKEFDHLSADDKSKLASDKNNIVNGVIENTIAEVLRLKTTQIESTLNDGQIITRLSDRGVTMYEIEEMSNYTLLNDVSINLFYLNRAAKYNFSSLMGVTPVSYGSIFLFRNGFRILPYGEVGDDSWGLNKRAQQGYNRYIGTRDLLGRVDVETNDVEAFKEVSSRDGGLIMNDSALQLMGYFNSIHRRLERYVSGVLWGESFIKNEYFNKENDAIRERKQLQEVEKESESAEHIYNSIGSRVDFLQLVKSLVNDSEITIHYYNESLANIVENVSDTEIIQAGLIDDLRKVAQKTSDNLLIEKIGNFEHQLTEMRHQKEEASRIAEEERRKAEAARRKAEEEKAAREKAEKERDAQIQKNNYLSATRDTSKEVEDLMHTVLISSSELNSLVSSQKEILNEDTIDRQELVDITHDIEFNVERIHVLSSLITKADTALLRDSVDVDVYKYAHEFLSYFSRKLTVSCIAENKENFLKKIQVLEYSVILQNLVSNSRKANASNVVVIFKKEDRRVLIDFSDDGVGVDLDLYTPETIFEVGVTNRPGGHGIGLSTIRDTLKRCMNGDIQFVGNGINNLKGATFRIILE